LNIQLNIGDQLNYNAEEENLRPNESFNDQLADNMELDEFKTDEWDNVDLQDEG
jgi:hypothetical protein